MKRYVMNVNGYFFEIRFAHDDIPWVEYYDSKDDLYKRVCEYNGCDLDEIEGGELIVDEVDDKEIKIVDDRGCVEYFGRDEMNCIINDYEM